MEEYAEMTSCPECNSPHLVRDYKRGELVCRPSARPTARMTPPCKCLTNRPCPGRRIGPLPDRNPTYRGGVWG